MGAVVVLFILGLDFLGWLTGTQSFLFNLILGKRHAGPEAETVARMVEESLSAEQVKVGVRRFLDDDGNLHLKVALAPEQFLRLAPGLKKRLAAEGAVLAGEEEESDRVSDYHLWEVRSPGGSRIHILFSCPKAAAGPAKKGALPEIGRRPEGPARAAVIMDDLGFSLEAARAACALGMPLTLSVLPFSPQAVASAQVAHEHGLEIMLHLPMESREHHETEKRTPGLIEARMPDEDIRLKVREQVYQVPYIRGVNNHMGSLLTEDADKMEVILSVLQEAGLYFVDSRTSASSRALEVARRLGLPAAGCDLFLDDANDASALRKNLARLLKIARRRGWALGIVHPYPATLEALKDCAALFEEQGVMLVPASEIVARISGR
ncbi:MAG: hypothetical protein A2Y56_05985 [Candidatus Aminicenantes bacterium RBG_13_63_10]|nr:MAG: hypothetical protein A2Y56_05985 [Candidatus Aminicenantes bacterium RBG_13_63_10]